MGVTRHGWVTPLPYGAKARCGGPGMCTVCQEEVQYQRHSESARGAAHDSALARTSGSYGSVGQPESDGTNRVCGTRPDADRATNETATRL
jgi:hypothetical protein